MVVVVYAVGVVLHVGRGSECEKGAPRLGFWEVLGVFQLVPVTQLRGGVKNAVLSWKVAGRTVAELLEQHLLKVLGADVRCF